MGKKIKLISWNVNGIRAILKKNFSEFVVVHKPDILCLQETKAHPDQVSKILSEYPYQYWNSAVKKGYSGTAIFSKINPLHVKNGFGRVEHDSEGRVITLEFDKYYLVNCYTPNAQPGLRRIKYRQNWDKAFLKHIKKLEKKKPVIFCGDLNVAHNAIDLARPEANEGSPGYSIEERTGFQNLIDSGLVDTFRYLHPKTVKYSWWSYRTRARERGVGWRIDYFGVSKKLISRIKKAEILDQVFGSDHCPVSILFSQI